jgi:hypothetical protein
MIFKGRVVVSLKEKFVNEYFMFYAGNYIGDYQILLSYKATETYTVYGDSTVFTHCISEVEFKDLMIAYPEAFNVFLVRGINRRVEFRRIKKVFETSAKTGSTVEEVFMLASKDILLKTLNDLQNDQEERRVGGTTPLHKYNNKQSFDEKGQEQKSEGSCKC